MGHSMGGHGALTLALRNPTAFRSVSAFAPICNPTQVPWGHKAFSNYLGEVCAAVCWVWGWGVRPSQSTWEVRPCLGEVR